VEERQIRGMSKSADKNNSMCTAMFWASRYLGGSANQICRIGYKILTKLERYRAGVGGEREGKQLGAQDEVEHWPPDEENRCLAPGEETQSGGGVMVVRILNKKETRLPVPELVGPQATVRPDYPS
jgi:hypothetical protein